MATKRKLYYAEKFFIKKGFQQGDLSGCGEKAYWYLATKV
jgi:hypothetical protein